MTSPPTPRKPRPPRLTQPADMMTRTYVSGVETVNGNDAWALFEACARGDAAKAAALLARDGRLVNAQFWYRFPIHMAVFGGHREVVRLLLARGADPGQSVYTYDSWDKLLGYARDRGQRRIEALIRRAMHQRFAYATEFDTLKDAIIGRDSGAVEAVLRRQSTLVRATDALGNNALHWAVITRQMNLIDRLVEAGTPIDAHRADGQTPVLLAVNGATDYWYRDTRGRTHPSLRNTSILVGYLLARGAEYTLSVAAALGDLERVEHLLAADPGLAARPDPAGLRPLSYAAREGHAHIVRRLLDAGADPNAPETGAPRGLALFNACCENHRPVVELLLKHGADPNTGSDSNGCCLTIGEVYHGDRAKPVQDLLRQHGAQTPSYEMTVREMKRAIRTADPEVGDPEFLGNVMRKCNPGLLDLYLDSDPTILTRMHFWSGVVYPRSPALIRRLLARGLNPNQPDWLGKTFLHACAELGDRAAAAVFLEAGADINARDLEFQGTPLAAAVRACGSGENPKQAHRQRRMVEFLLDRGAATNLPGDEAWATPLAWATRSGQSDIVDLLKRHGA